MRSSRRLGAGALLALLAAGPGGAQPIELRADRVLQRVPATVQQGVASALSNVGLGCATADQRPLSALTLLDAIERVLCRSPQLVQSVWLVDEQLANVEAAQAGLRPRVFASAEWASNRIPSSNSAAGSLSSSITGSLGLTWALYDAGARQAGLEQARQQLDAARATQLNTVLTALNEVMRLYVEAAVAGARLEALREAESTARRSLDAVGAKYGAEVASLAERLQAETALAQASLERIRAEGQWETTRGLLAVAMGLAPRTQLGLAPVDAAFPATVDRSDSADWTAQVRARHPRLQAARADVQALRARLDAVRADGRPNVQASLGANTTRDISSPGARFEHSLSSSVIASVPLFNEAEQRAREAQVQAQVGTREATLAQLEQELDGELWRAARTMDTEAENLRAAATLLTTATRSHEITEGRYRAGVGSILELLATQAALANARSQVVQARIGYAQARLRLEVLAGTVRLQR